MLKRSGSEYVWVYGNDLFYVIAENTGYGWRGSIYGRAKVTLNGSFATPYDVQDEALRIIRDQIGDDLLEQA